MRDALPELRSLTTEPPEVFVPEVQAICAGHGVAVVFVAEMEGARASGVMRWLTPEKALVQLSSCYKSDDHLWFTLFHELGHVLLHGKTDLWVEDGHSPDRDPKELEADRFSSSVLIPPADASVLSALKSDSAVIDFAHRIGIAPGVVVGRLQHDCLWSPEDGDELKKQIDLAQIEHVSA